MRDYQPAGLSWNYDRSELVADAIVHGVGIGLALVGAMALAAAIHGSTRAVAPVWIYAGGLLSMLAFSAAYNLWPVSPWKWILRRFDHSGIYLLIAATYTPFVAPMKHAAGMLMAIWSAAAGGIAIKLLFPGRFDRASIALYLLLGWSGVMIFQPVLEVLPSATLWLLAIGGALYSIGVVFHLCKLRFQNAIWHAFVVLAAACHYTAVLAFVR